MGQELGWELGIFSLEFFSSSYFRIYTFIRLFKSLKTVLPVQNLVVDPVGSRQTTKQKFIQII